jgi:hypothetical protein
LCLAFLGRVAGVVRAGLCPCSVDVEIDARQFGPRRLRGAQSDPALREACATPISQGSIRKILAIMLILEPTRSYRPAPIVFAKAPLMTNYSICFLDKNGHATHSEFTPFDADSLAVSYARGAIGASFMVEVWKDNNIVERLTQPGSPGTSGAVR